MTIPELFEQFATERRYLQNVRPKTLEWYKFSYRAFAPHVADLPCVVSEMRDGLKRAVMTLASSKLQPTSLNDYIRAWNAFLRWAHAEGHLTDPIKIPYLREEQKVIQALTQQHIDCLLSWKPRTFADHRLAALVALLLDNGVRISEALALKRSDVDFDNLLIRVTGKGGRERVLPMSVGLRKILFKFLYRHEHMLVFPTLHGTPCDQRDLLKKFVWLAGQLRITGVRFSPHTLRHSFAVNYLKAGGNAFYLQKMLGHSTLEMTNRYVRSLGIDDLQAVHNRLSLLMRG